MVPLPLHCNLLSTTTIKMKVGSIDIPINHIQARFFLTYLAYSYTNFNWGLEAPSNDTTFNYREIREQKSGKNPKSNNTMINP
jgi:hypothetical protein